LKNGVNDIKNHRFYKSLDWLKLLSKSINPPYIPTVKNDGDTSNFSTYPDSSKQANAVKKVDDPFLSWFAES